MMEIKFRALTRDGKWIYTSKDWMFNFEGNFAWNPGRGEGPTCVPLEPGTIGQLAGLVDKNGTEIFEGDILEYVSPEEDEQPRDIYVVEWKDHGFRASWWKDGARAKNQGMDGLTGADEDMQIVGNIYSTPELLTKAVI